MSDSPCVYGWTQEEKVEERLRGIRWRLDAAAFGYLRNASTEVPVLLEAITMATEWLVKGERDDRPNMEVFKKHTILEAFVCALRTESSPQNIKVQVLQSLAMLVPQVRRSESLIYLLSVLNPCFEVPPDFEDEEMLAYFVTLMKSLAIRIDVSNVQHCLVPADGNGGDRGRACRMPVLQCAMQLVGHEEAMVRTAARAAVLSIMRVDHLGVRDAAEEPAKRLLAPPLARIGRQATSAKGTPMEAEGLLDLEDLLGFVEDLFRLDIPFLTQALEFEGFFGDSEGRWFRPLPTHA
eukprot:TRINITY_DN61756_c0_g1_i1.p1 TRINITY_DN61756_c0_g1~~TRINITY_DN61756_c0_g1_i1.p1  ORF type:complete len:294 (-),score=75.92 TRINITY_DN61756_c0_g1_i1:398-1279(-)